jgi:hypothetical protein
MIGCKPVFSEKGDTVVDLLLDAVSGLGKYNAMDTNNPPRAQGASGPARPGEAAPDNEPSARRAPKVSQSSRHPPEPTYPAFVHVVRIITDQMSTVTIIWNIFATFF